MEGLRKSEKFMSEYKLSIFLTLAMLAMLFFTAGMKTDAAEVPNGLVVNNGVISYYENETVVKNTWKTVDGKKLKSVYLIATRDLSNLWLQFFLSQNQGFMRLFEKTVLK